MFISQARKWTLFTACIFLVGCSVQPTNTTNSKLSDTPIHNGSPNTYTETKQEETIAGPIAPLTNLPSNSILTRPILFMVENSPKARPQTGLDKADVVYEILAEGDITRFAAVYHSQPATVIGPVRSIRPYFVQLGAALDAVIVHAGWSPDAMQTIKELDVDHFDQVYGDEAYYWRDSTRKMPHNLYTNTEKIVAGAKAKKMHSSWDGRGWLSAADGQTKDSDISQMANEITIPYMGGYDVSYQWDETSKHYLRYYDGKAHYDRASNQQLTANNILICKTSHQILDDKLRQKVNIEGPGEGWLVQNGRMMEVKWELQAGLVRALDANGNEMAMVPGKTWIQFVPKATKISSK